MNSRLHVAALALAVLAPLAACSSDSTTPAPSNRGLTSAALNAGLRVTLSAQQSSPGATQVTFTAVVADDDGSGPGYTVDFGDGKTETVPAPTVPCSDKRSTSTPIAKTLTMKHRYARAGTYAVSVEVTSGTACPLPARETQTALTLVNVSNG